MVEALEVGEITHRENIEREGGQRGNFEEYKYLITMCNKFNVMKPSPKVAVVVLLY